MRASRGLLLMAMLFCTLSGIAISQDRAQYFEKGTLRFTGTDNDGWASVYT